MKKIALVIMAIFVGWLNSVAQSGLNIAQFLDDSYASHTGVTQVSMTGKQLKWVGITKYMSVSVASNAPLADKIRSAVAKDGAKAVEKKVSYKEGQLYFGFYTLDDKGKCRRYIFYLNRRPVGEEKTTLIFLEGSVDSDTVLDLINK